MSKLIGKILSTTHPTNTSNTIDDYSNNYHLSMVNSQELQIARIEKILHNWTIPKIDVKTIYQIGKFWFSSRL